MAALLAVTAVAQVGQFPYDLQSLVINNNVCDVLTRYPGDTAGSAYYCSGSGQWMRADKDITRMQQSSRPAAWGILTDADIAHNVQPSSCCAPTDCWNGTKCIDDQSLATHYLPTINLPTANNNYRCVNGTWKDLAPKTTWDNDQLGYCPEMDGKKRCLIKPDSGAKNWANNDMPDLYYSRDVPSCIRADQYVEDHICDPNGNWTSRTKLLALNMLSITESSQFRGQPYTLFCDEAAKVFDDLTPLARQGLPGRPGRCLAGALNDTEVPCYNNFCLLRINDGAITVVGTSLNTQLESSPSFAGVIRADLPVDTCAAATGSTFSPCKEPGVYYNRAFKLVIYVPGGTGVSFSSLEALDSAMLGSKNRLIRSATEITAGNTTRGEFTFFGKRNDIDIFYAAQRNTKRLFGLVEANVASQPLRDRANTDKRDFIGVLYQGPAFDICSFINARDKLALCRAETTAVGTDVLIAQQRLAGSAGSTIVDAWRDLTAKLRP
jgi:hypothetical protein